MMAPFREEGLIRGIALSADGHQMGGMGVGVGDYNLDGHTDLVKTHFLDQATGIYSNDGKGNFDDRDNSSGSQQRNPLRHASALVWSTSTTTATRTSSSPPAPSILNWIASRPGMPLRTPRVLFRNRGDGTFAEVGAEAGPGIVARHCGRGLAFGDFDNDGDMDVLIMNVNEPPSLLRNDAPAGNHWIKIRLEGVKSNRSAIGARVLAHYGGKVQAQEVLSQSSYLSASDPRLHFGLGAATTADIEIYWPLGLVEKYTGSPPVSLSPSAKAKAS